MSTLKTLLRARRRSTRHDSAYDCTGFGKRTTFHSKSSRSTSTNWHAYYGYATASKSRYTYQETSRSKGRTNSTDWKDEEPVDFAPSRRKASERRTFKYSLTTDKAIRALALCLCKEQPAGLEREAAVFDLVCDISAVDRLLLLSGWQGRSFLSTENICFVHMVMCHARYLVCKKNSSQLQEQNTLTKNSGTGDDYELPLEQLRQLLQAVLYISFCYVGGETGYPAWPFKPYRWELDEFHQLCFWLSLAISRPMLDYNRSAEWQKVYHNDLKRFIDEEEQIRSEKERQLRDARENDDPFTDLDADQLCEAVADLTMAIDCECDDLQDSDEDDQGICMDFIEGRER